MLEPDYRRRSAPDIAYYDRLAPVYFERHQQPIQKMASSIEGAWFRWLCASHPRRVLLVGIGGGREIEFLRNLNAEIVAIDYSSEMIRIGQEFWRGHNIVWHHRDVHDGLRDLGEFDLVICLSALNYFVDIEVALRNISDAVKSGGVCVLSSINVDHRTEKNALNGGRYNRCLYSVRDIKNIISRNNLVFQESRGIRFFVDLLPSSWSKASASGWRRWMLQMVMLVERFAAGRLPARWAKFFWILSYRPEG